MADLMKLVYTDATLWFKSTQIFLDTANWSGLIEIIPPCDTIEKSMIWNSVKCLYFRVRLAIQKNDERIAQLKKPTEENERELKYYEAFMQKVISRGKALESEKSQRWDSALAYFYYNRWIGNKNQYYNYNMATRIYETLLNCDHPFEVDKYRSNKLYDEYLSIQLLLPEEKRKVSGSKAWHELTTVVLEKYQTLITGHARLTKARQAEYKNAYIGSLYSYVVIVIKLIFIKEVECVLKHDFQPHNLIDPIAIEKYKSAYFYIKELFRLIPQDITKENIEGKKPHIIDLQYRYAQALLICAAISRYQNLNKDVVINYLRRANDQFMICEHLAKQAKQHRIRINTPYYIYSSWAVALFLLNKPQEAFSKLCYVIESKNGYIATIKLQCKRVYNLAATGRFSHIERKIKYYEV